MTTENPAYGVIAVCVVIFLLAPFGAFAQTSRSIEGSWELVEWVHEGEALVAPAIGGRFSLKDGVVLFQVFRKTEDGEVSTQGFGRYRFEDQSFFYGYDRSVGIRLRSDGAPEVKVFSPASPTLRGFSMERTGARVLLKSETGNRGFVVEGDSLHYVHEGKPLRKYRRMGEH